MAVAYVKLVSSTLHPYLVFPRIEMLVVGLVINSLTFFSSLAINGPQSEWRDSKLAAVFYLTCVAAPYIVFLWWITIGRIVAQASVSA